MDRVLLTEITGAVQPMGDYTPPHRQIWGRKEKKKLYLPPSDPTIKALVQQRSLLFMPFWTTLSIAK